MCPAGVALQHPAADLLMEYATIGCPTKTGKCWTMDNLEAGIKVGPHVSALDPEAMEQLQSEVKEKEALVGQAKVVIWGNIMRNPPKAVKISCIAMIPHKSRKFWAILDLSHAIKLMQCRIKAVNDTTTKMAPQGMMDQMGHVLNRIIYVYAEAEEGGHHLCRGN